MSVNRPGGTSVRRAMRIGPHFVPALLLLSAIAASPSPGWGQDAAGAGAVEGVVFDSLSGGPLAGARVVLEPAGRDALTDEGGRFAFPGVAEGEYRLSFTHQELPTWAVEASPVGVSVPGAPDMRLTTRSPGYLASRYCTDDGQRLGAVTVRDLLTMVPIPGAEVTVRAGPERSRLAPVPVARTDGRGEVRFCLDPSDTSIAVGARIGTTDSRMVTLLAAEPFVHQSLFLQTTAPSRIEGVVLEEGSRGSIADVTISVRGSRTRVVTDRQGRFTLPGVPPGEIELVAEHIAYGSAEGEILVGVGDTLDVEILMAPTAIELAPLSVEVMSSTTARRIARASRFDGLTREQIDALLPRVVDFQSLLRHANIPGLRVQDVYYHDPRTRRPRPGVCIEVGRRHSRYDDACDGMVEVFLNGSRVSRPEDVIPHLPPGSIESVEVLSPLDAQVQYGGGLGSRNGVLLITTR